MMSAKKRDSSSGEHPPPDSTTREKLSFCIGDEVLMQRRDGNFYFGAVIKIDLSREQCLVKFGDNTESWSTFSRLAKLSTGVDVTCVKCKSSETKADNDIAVCDKCSRGYHQLCHQPHIKNEDFGGELKWECSRCQDLPDRRQLPLRKSSAPPLPQVLIQPAVPPPPPLRPTSPTNRLPPNVATEANKKKLPYNLYNFQLADLTWDMQHRVNSEGKYCYCGNNGKWFLQMLQCGRCRQWFHGRCIASLRYPLLFGDRFYVFICTLCNAGSEFLRRLEVKWVDLIHLAAFNLTLKMAKKYQDVEDFIKFINTNWKNLQLPPKILETQLVDRRELIISNLTSNRNRFKCSREVKKRTTMWGLKVRVPPPTPAFSLPPNRPLSDQVLSDAWNNNARLQFLPVPPDHLLPIKDYNFFPDWETININERLPGLELLRIETRPFLILPKGLSSAGQNACIKSSTPFYPESRSQIERRIKAQETDRLQNFRNKKNRKVRRDSLDKNKDRQELPPTPPSSESNPEVLAQPDTSGDESSSRGTLDSIIPPPADFDGRNNPFLSTSLPLTLAPVVRPTKRRLSEKDIRITSSGEIKRRRVRRSKLDSNLSAGRKALNARRLKSGPSTPSTSPIKSQPNFNMDDLKSTVNHYFGALNRIASGEKFTVKAKRITPDGKIQYLINWGCSPT
ncbi:polycomb protein Pcl isoform X3 [Rhodnius prolixus]|uniref:polycomb protein Pcl isoform X3 n=1 Tax=Rhodnius prolixus TaxID=13249 RepID=UPI003D18E828